MKKIAAYLLFVSLFLMSFLNAGSQLSKKDRKKAVSYFEETKSFLQKEIAGLNETQLNWKPADSIWSIANCVEHIAVSEEGIFEWAISTLKEAPDKTIDISKRITDDHIKKETADRTKKGKAPEVFVPSGRYGNTAESYSYFSNKRDSLIQYIKTTKDDLRGHYINSFMGVMDSYQLLILLSGHTNRHTLQIVELKAMPGFPTK